MRLNYLGAVELTPRGQVRTARRALPAQRIGTGLQH
jgi:hypothetical protein